ncbi:hypothetical protein D3C76_899260 [compost metagenome]
METLFPEALRREGPDPPVLSGAIEDIRRRAHGDHGQQFVLAGPGLAAGAVGAHRQVGDQADTHAGGHRADLRALQAAGDQPLAEGVKLDFSRVLHGEALHRGVLRVAQVLRPEPPVSGPAAVQHVPVQGLEAAVQKQGVAAAFAKTLEVVMQRPAVALEVAVELAQQGLAGPRYRGPVDQGEGFQAVELRAQPGRFQCMGDRGVAQHAGRRRVQHIEVQPAGG